MQETTVRIDAETHRRLEDLAKSMGASLGETVALAVRRLRQDQVGDELKQALSDDELTWLDTDLR